MIRRLIVLAVVLGLVAGAVPVGAETATLSASGPDTADAGETVTISYTLTNTGDNSSGYILDISIPEEWNVENQTGDGATWQEGEYDWLWQTIRSGESVSPSVTLSIPASAEGNTATITAVVKTADGVEARANRTVTVTSSDSDGGGGGGGEGSTPATATDTITATPTATPTPTPTPTPISTPTVEPSTSTATETTGSDAPGFSPVITLGGLLSAVILVLRQHS